MGLGLLSASWERGSPDLPTFGLQRGSTSDPVRPVFINPSSRTLRSKASSGTASPGRLVRRRRDQGRGTSRGACDASHDDRGQAGASLRCVLVSSLVQREQAQERASGKGIHFGAIRPRPAQRQGRSHCGAQAGVTTRAFDRRGPTLVRISVPDVPF